MTQIVELAGKANLMVIGEVTGIRIRDEHLVDGRFDVLSFHPVARLGYRDYAAVTELFQMSRPGE